ncbi:MAG: MlaD family protein [Opitutales bacterium]|nr:MlaD family protein [Opitutales bacterium]
MKNKYEAIRVFIFTFLGIGLIAVVYTLLGSSQRLNKAENYYTAKASFTDLRQLKIGDDVRIAGVPVGHIRDLYLEGAKGVAILVIRKKITIPEDSIAFIGTAGMLGANYIAIEPGRSSLPLQSGASLYTQSAPDLNSVLKEMSELLRVNQENLNRIVSNLADVTHQLTTTDGLMGKLLNDPQMGQNFQSIVENIRLFSETLNKKDSSLGRLLHDDKLYNKAESALDKVNTAVDSLQNAGPVSAVGATAGALF